MNNNNCAQGDVCPCCGRPGAGGNMMQMGPMVYYGTYPVSMPGLNWPPMSAYSPWMPMPNDWMTEQAGMNRMGMNQGGMNQMGMQDMGQMCNTCQPPEFGAMQSNSGAMGSAGNQRIPFPENLEN